MNDWREKARLELAGVRMTPDYPMSELTTFKIGGPLDLLVEPADTAQLERAVVFCEREAVPWLVLGLGSNLLVRDKGVRGVGIRLIGEFLQWRSAGARVIAGAGVTLADLAQGTAELGLAGLEFACGIPGSVGGAVFMNASAYDGEIAQVLTAAEVYWPGRGLAWFPAAALKLGYRFSRFHEEPAVISRAEFALRPADRDGITARIADLTCQRQAKQPLELPSAGSTFRRPVGHYVGPLIEKAGLKGYAIGGAQVSPKHAGFIVNAGNACAADVLGLIDHIRRVVRDNDGVDLIPEIRVIGEE